MIGRFFLPFRYDPDTKEFVPEFYTNVAENVFYSNPNLPGVETVKQALDSYNERLEGIQNPVSAADGMEQTAITGLGGETLSVNEALAELAERLETGVNVGEELKDIRDDLSDIAFAFQTSVETARPVIFTAKLTASGWSGIPPQTQSIKISGLPEGKCIIDIIQSADEEQAKIELREREKIRLMKTCAGELTAICHKDLGAPSVDLNLEILSLRTGFGDA